MLATGNRRTTAGEPPAALPTEGTFTVRQVSRLFDVPERRLRYWSQTGFITPSSKQKSRVLYSFRDLIAVKVAKALLDSGLPLRRVRRSLQALRIKLPQAETSLSRLRVRCDHDQVVVDEADCSYEATTGQLVLDFEVASLHREAADVVTMPGIDDADDDAPDTAYEWFLHACELEAQWGGAPADTAGFEAARQAYMRALELDPQLAAAWTNLGSMMAERGELDEAQEHYERAVACDPEQPEAQCNLAELSLREGDAEAAVSAYRAVLRGCPDWLEAHYGLARALLALGGKGQALAHLERFCAAVDSMPEVDRDPELRARREDANGVIADLRRQLAR
jgi:tetratricopeptide (TPR) repeat protein